MFRVRSRASRTAAVFILSLLLAVVPLGAEPDASGDEGDAQHRATVVLTHKSHALRSDPVLDCRRRVNAFLTFDRPLVGRRLLEGTWILPDGQVDARAEIPLRYPDPGRRTAMLWLEIDHRSGAGGMQPGSLPGDPRYEGRWLLEVRLDRRTLLKIPFEMVCS